MGGIAKAIFGDDSAKKAQQQAQAEAAKSRELQQIANDRQLAAANDAETKVGATRAAPRGRRLFESDASSGGLATTLGG